MCLRLSEQFVHAPLHGSVVVPGFGETVFPLGAVAPQTANNFTCKLVHCFSGLRVHKLKVGGVNGAADGVFTVLALIDDDSRAVSLENVPVFLFHPLGDALAVVVGTARNGHEVASFDCAGGLDRVGRLHITAESRRDLGCQLTHAGIHPVTGAALVGKPPMDGQHHLVGFRRIVQCLGLIAEPEQLRLAVALADVGAKLDEPLVHHILEHIRLGIVAGALNGDCSLVVGCGRGTPGAVLLFHIHSDPTIDTDAVVAACLP